MSVYQVRKTASAAFTGLVSESDVHQYCNSILARCADGMSSNEVSIRVSISVS